MPKMVDGKWLLYPRGTQGPAPGLLDVPVWPAAPRAGEDPWISNRISSLDNFVRRRNEWDTVEALGFRRNESESSSWEIYLIPPKIQNLALSFPGQI